MVVVLPIVSTVSTRYAYDRLRHTYPFQRHEDDEITKLFYLTILALQLFYEMVIVIISLRLVPNGGLEEQWALLYRKDQNAIKRIQDTFECCGFNTTVVRAWPFLHRNLADTYGEDQCEMMYKRAMPCVGPWRQAEQINYRLFTTIAIVIFVVKVCSFLVLQA